MAENENVKSTSEEVELTAVENNEDTSVQSIADTPAENNETAPAESVEDGVEQKVEATQSAETQQAEEGEPSKASKFAADVKEWFRKFIVNLKHKPQNIAFVVLIVTSFMYMCFLGTFSEFISYNSGIKWLGLFEFVNTLASILVIMIFLNTFPKRKKMNIIMLVLTFAVLALMLVFDILFYVNIVKQANTLPGGLSDLTGDYASTLNFDLIHMIFLAITIVVLALLPVYKKLLMKINTSKELASNDIKEEIDTSEENG